MDFFSKIIQVLIKYSLLYVYLWLNLCFNQFLKIKVKMASYNYLKAKKNVEFNNSINVLNLIKNNKNNQKKEKRYNLVITVTAVSLLIVSGLIISL